MDSLITQETFPESPEIQQSIADFIAILNASEPSIISAPGSIKLLLNTKGKKSYILKRQRTHADNSLDTDDSFIIGVPVGRDILGIKIHPDTWAHCRRIYERPELLTRLTAENDIPNILRTIHIEGFRVVFYIWEKSSILPYHIKRYPERIPQIQIALRARIKSLGHKGIALAFSEPEDFIYSPPE